MEDIRAAFGRRVRELREGQRLSQEDLAERAQMHWTYVGGIERGERNVSVVNIEKLAVGLGISLAGLFEPFREVGAMVVSAPRSRAKRPDRRKVSERRRGPTKA